MASPSPSPSRPAPSRPAPSRPTPSRPAQSPARWERRAWGWSATAAALLLSLALPSAAKAEGACGLTGSTTLTALVWSQDDERPVTEIRFQVAPAETMPSPDMIQREISDEMSIEDLPGSPFAAPAVKQPRKGKAPMPEKQEIAFALVDLQTDSDFGHYSGTLTGTRFKMQPVYIDATWWGACLRDAEGRDVVMGYVRTPIHANRAKRIEGRRTEFFCLAARPQACRQRPDLRQDWASMVQPALRQANVPAWDE